MRQLFWLSLSLCTSLLLFDNSHLLLLLCSVQMTKWGNGLWKMIINAAGSLTRKELFFFTLRKRNIHSSPARFIVLFIHYILLSTIVQITKDLMFFFLYIFWSLYAWSFYSLSKLSNNVSCSIQRYVKCMNCGKNTSCYSAV